MSSIRISGLVNLPVITADDFFPIVDSGSLTTYRTPVQSVADFIAASGSASFALTARSSSYALSSSWSNRSGTSASSSFLIFPNNSTASFSLVSISSSLTISSSFASKSVTSSFSQFSLSSLSASFATNAISSSRAITSSFSTTSSFSQNAFTSSYALTASRADNCRIADTASFLPSSGIKAWANVTWSGAGKTITYIEESSNISSVTYLNTVGFMGIRNWDRFGIRFISPLGNTNYMCQYSAISSAEKFGYLGRLTHYSKSVNGFTMSVCTDSGNGFDGFYTSTASIAFTILGQ